MRAAQGAAAPVTKPKKEPGVDARPVLALSVQLSAAMNPRIGESRVGEAPRPFFPPISSGRNGGPGRAGPAGRLGLHQTGGYCPPLRAWQLAYRAGQARTLADGGPGRTPQMGRPPRRHPGTPHPPQRGEGSGRAMRAPRGHARFRTKKRAARDTGGACVYRSSRKYAKPRLAGGCLSRLLRREVKISTTTVTT